VHFNPFICKQSYKLQCTASNECINSLKGSARIIDEVITGDCTKINKVRTREFTREIIAGEPQLICRMKNDKQA
jgi:hypothetical protein